MKRLIVLSLILLNYIHLFGQIDTKIVGLTTNCIGQSSNYSVSVNSYPNKYLFRDTVAANSGGNGFFALAPGYATDAISNTFSYDLWVKPTRSIIMASESSVCMGGVSVPLANSDQNWVLLPSASGTGLAVGLSVGTNGIMVGEHSSNILLSRLSYVVTLNDWVHIGVVYRPDSIFLYLNGNIVRGRQTPCSSNNKFIATGFTGYYYSQDFKGDFDEFRLWDIPLTKRQIDIIKDKKIVNQIAGLRYFSSFDNGKFERTLGDIGNQLMTVTGLSTEKHIKLSSWSLSPYTGETIETLTPFDLNQLQYLWSTGATTKIITYAPNNSINKLWVRTYNSTFSKTDTLVITGTSCSNTQIPTNGLVAYYPFNGNANDESPNANHGIAAGASLTTDRNGVANSAYYFNGVDNFIKVPGSFPITNTFTISFWAFCESGSGYHNILSDGSSSAGGADFLINFKDNNIGIRADKDAPLNYEDNYPASLSGLDIINKWVQVTWVMNPASSTIYLNGNQIALINEAGTNLGYHDSFSFIGARQVWGSPDYFFKGKIDDICMYDRALSSNEVNTLFTGNSPQLTVSTNALTITAQANSTKTFNITSNTSWTVSSNQTWLTVGTASGTGNAIVTLTAAANPASTSRTAAITVIGTGVTDKIITVTQMGNGSILTVSTNTLALTAQANSTNTFKITSNTNWTISSNQAWLALSSKIGAGDSTITLTATTNLTTVARTATIIVSATGVTSKFIAVTQEGASPVLTLSTDSLIIAAYANSSKTFAITSTLDWTIVSDQSWFTVSNLTGLGNKTITLTATLNPTVAARYALVTVSATGVLPQTIVVIQNGSAPTINVSKTSITLESANNSTGSFNIVSNTSWSAKSNQSWLTLSSESGSNNALITITANANQSTTRTATITVSSTGLASKTITVTQTGSIVSTLTVDPSTLTFTAAANGVKPFKITSNISWWITCNQTWLTTNIVSGAGNKTINITAITYHLVEPRTATITISGAGVAQQIITVTQTGISTDVENNENIQNIGIYPNPSSGLFNLNLNNLNGDKVAIRISDLIGNVVQEFQMENLPTEYKQEIDLSDLAGGVYIVTVQTPCKIAKRVILSKR